MNGNYLYDLEFAKEFLVTSTENEIARNTKFYHLINEYVEKLVRKIV